MEKRVSIKKRALTLQVRGLKVAVEAGEQEIYPKIGKDDRTKTPDREQGGLFSPPRTRVSSM